MALNIVVVADASRARLFSANRLERPWTLLEEHDSPEARLHETELASDRAGQKQSPGGHRTSVTQPTTLHEQAAVRFAALLKKAIDALLTASPEARLVLVAPPSFLGRLRAGLSAQAARRLHLALDKDLVRESAAGLASHFA